MGNHPPRATITSPGGRPMSPIHEGGRNSRGFSFNTKRGSIYNEILRDAEKLRSADQKNHYNQHRRVESIASNLPNQLESYCNAVFIVNEFWINHIEQLSEYELNELVMVLWAHLFLKFKERRHILITAQKGNMGSHALKILHVFGYVIRNIINPSNHLKLFKQLQALGAVHRGYGITTEVFDALLESINYTMEEKFNNEFKVRTRFCFSQIYQVIVDIMCGEDFYSFTMSRLSNTNTFGVLPLNDNETSSKTEEDLDEDELNAIMDNDSVESTRSSQLQTLYHQLDAFLGSLEECLSDEIGSLYFKKYLEEQFCSENFLFHEAVLKYKSANGKHRIKLGQQIIYEFVAINSAKEVNLSYNTRKQILSIVNLVHKLNENKDKYQQLLSVKKSNHLSIMNEDDIAFLKHEEPLNGHYRMATTKKVGIELAEITSDLDANIEDVIYSMGFTDALFDSAYDEIFHLMKTNAWHKFRNAILEYCGDDEFRKLQKKKLELKKQEQKQTVNMVQVINSIARSHQKFKDDAYADLMDDDDDDSKIELNKQISIHDLLSPRRTRATTFSTQSQSQSHHNQGNVMIVKKKSNQEKQSISRQRRRSKDDLDIDLHTNTQRSTLPRSGSYKVRSYRPRINNNDDEFVPLGPVNILNLNESISCNEDDIVVRVVDDDESKEEEGRTSPITIDHTTTTVLEEDLEYTIHRDAFKPRNRPRLSFIPTIMPSIEKSETSPTVKTGYNLNRMRASNGKNTSSGMTPGGGACVEMFARADDGNNGKYSPSELFNLVSSTFPWDYINKSGDEMDMCHAQIDMDRAKSKKEQEKKRISGIYRSPNGELPLYVTHKNNKKRKSKKFKKKSIKFKKRNMKSSDKTKSV